MLAPVMKKVGPNAADMIRADHTRVVAAFHAESLLGGELNALGARMAKQRAGSVARRAGGMGAAGVLAGVLLGGWTLRRLLR